MSQQDLANQLFNRGGGRFEVGSDRSRVTLLENGDATLTYDHCHVFAEIFGVTTGAFFAATHVVSRLRDGETKIVEAYANGLEAMAKEMRLLAAEPFPKGRKARAEAQRKAFHRLFDTWIAAGFDATTKPDIAG